MRKTLETIALGALAFLFWITHQALYGPDPLPDRIPTHFNLAGQPDGWGSHSTLFLLPVVASALYLLITLGGLLPASFKAPIRVMAENRARLEALSHQMLAWFKVDLVCLFTWIQWSILDGARNGNSKLSPAILPVFLVAIFGALGWHIVAMLRTCKPASSS
jgi:uncharacterized membrane protein